MTGYVKRFPHMAGRLARRSGQSSAPRTLAVIIFESIEGVCPKVPEKCGDHQTCGVHSNAWSRVEAEHLAGGYQKRERPQQRPEPTQLDQVLVEERVAVSEVDFWEPDKVADHGRDQQDQVDEQSFMRREKQIFSARKQQHGQEYVEHSRRFPDQQRAFGIGSHG